MATGINDKREGAEMKSKNTPVERDFVDKGGVQKRVLVPEGTNDLSVGIPVSLDISSLYDHMPHEFVVEFTAALHAQGLVKPSDYFLVGASDKYRAALLMVIRHDFLNIQALAKEELVNRS